MENNYNFISSLLQKSALGADRVPKYFKTTKGGYAEHDVFIGVPVPVIRKITKDFYSLPNNELQALLSSKINEERFAALVILVHNYQKSETIEKEKIYQFYMQNLPNVNNWNLVDLSCRDIIGKHLFDKKKDLLLKLANSDNLWERRISIVSSWYFILNHQFDWTIKLATILLNDKEDLIHKAVGWMLREMGKKDILVLENFLEQNANKMPRTALRYAIEKFEPSQRQCYLEVIKNVD